MSNKSTICGVILGQCDVAMHAKLEMPEDWDANCSDLLFVLKAAQAACVSVQENFSYHLVARNTLCSFANCFQNSENPLVFKQAFLACTQKMEKAGISFKFCKKFPESGKVNNLKLADNTEATKAATNRFFGIMWLMNSYVSESMTNNLVQAYCSGDDKYPASVDVG